MIIKDNKRESLEKYIASINNQVPSNEIWRKIKKIEGHKKNNNITVLENEEKIINNQNELNCKHPTATPFAENSCDHNLDAETKNLSELMSNRIKPFNEDFFEQTKNKVSSISEGRYLPSCVMYFSLDQNILMAVIFTVARLICSLLFLLVISCSSISILFNGNSEMCEGPNISRYFVGLIQSAKCSAFEFKLTRYFKIKY